MAANGFDDDQTRSFTNLAAGTKVSHYKIILKIGAGGMGEVYLAEDTQLDRRVALKFLPPHLSQDEAARARFIREAKAVAKLDHPNVVQVFEVGEFQGRPFFAMANVEGKSLREVIKEGKLSINDAIELTKQICEGLHKAHESGIVHRDIKPGNIMIDADGNARILDFGLATVAGEDKLTKTGSTLGTVGYMAPEQVEGKSVDHRADLFSVGVILYEMLTGRRPFEGDTDAAVARSITDTTPDPVARYKSGTTGELQQIVDKALTKEPSLRYQHADGLLADLKRIEIGIPVARRKRSRIKSLAVIVAVAVTVLVSYYLTSHDSDHPSPPVRKRQVTFDGDVYSGAISPDGKFLAYIRGIHGGISKPATADSMKLYILDLDGGEPIKIFTDWWITGVWWTPDGRQLLVRGNNAIKSGFYLMPRLGGPSRFYPIEGLGTYWRVSWSPDGSLFVAASDYWPKSFFVVEKLTGQFTRVDVDGDFDWIMDLAWVPTTAKLLLVVNDQDGNRTCIMPVTGGDLKEISRGTKRSFNWAADGKSLTYIGSNGDLLSRGFDAKKDCWTGEPKLLVADVTSPYNPVFWDSSRTTLCYLQRSQWSNLRAVDIDTTGTVNPGFEELTSGTAQYVAPSISPDGKSVLCTRIVNRQAQVVVLNLETKEISQVSHTGSYNLAGAWSPDGDRLAYATIDKGVSKLAIADAAGGAPAIYDSCIVNKENFNHSPIAWSPSNTITYEVPGVKSLMNFDLDAEIQRRIGPADADLGFQFVPLGSPLGDTYVFFWNLLPERENYQENGALQSGVWLSSIKGDEAKLLASKAFPLRWSADGEWVYAWRFDQRFLLKVSTITGVVDSLGFFPNAPAMGVAISLEAQKLIYVHVESSTDLWLMENIPEP